jgi:hypothetical protein
MEDLWKKYGGSIQFVAVNIVETLANLTNWLAAMPGGITFPVLHSSNWSIAGLYWTGPTLYFPLMYIIGADGIIQRVYSTGSLLDESVLEGSILDVVHTRSPVDVELVVDVSDSMNSPPPGLPGGDSKLLLLKQAANIVMDVFVAHGQASDRMGLVRFTDSATEFEYANKKLLPLVLNEVPLRGEIGALTTGTCTAMGAGLQLAFDTLATVGTQQRFAILCTDGMQNVEPKVTDIGGHYEIVDSGGWLCGGHSGVPAHPGVDIRTYNTRVHTIGIGLGAEWEPLLQAVADQTGGFHRATDDPQMDLNLIYAVDLCSCLAAGSPVVVCHAAGTLISEECQAVETFYLNRTTRKITIALSWQQSESCSLTFWLRAPDGTLVPLDRQMQNFANRCLATLFLPVEQGGKKLDHVGRWSVIIRGETPVGRAGYQILVIAEDHDVKCIVDYPRRPYAAGDIVPLSIRLSDADKLPYRVVDLALEVIRLRVPPAEILERYPMSQLELGRTAHEGARLRRDPRALLQAKLRRIETDRRMEGLLRPERKRTSLRAGTLECSIGEREVMIPLRLTQPGLSSYRVEILCESAESGPIARTDFVSVFANAGSVDPKRSTVGVATRRREGGAGAVITMTPRNELGQLLGPGLAAEIRVVSGHKPLEAVVSDLVDGTYEIEIVRAPKLAELHASVLVQGKTIWTGNV